MGNIITYNTEMLSMIYTSSKVLKYKDIIIFELDLGKTFKIFVYRENSTGYEYEDVLRYNIIRSILVIQSTKSVLIFDLKEMKLLEEYECDYNGYYIITDSAILITKCNKLTIFSISNKNATTVETKTKFNAGKYTNIKIEMGRCIAAVIYYNKVICINFRSGELIDLIEGTFLGSLLIVDKNKNAFCDLVIKEIEHSVMDAQIIRLICGNKSFKVDEYFKYLNIKSYTPVIKNIKNLLGNFNVISHYNIITNNGYRGVMSNDMRNLKINDVPRLKKYNNLLSSTYEDIKDTIDL